MPIEILILTFIFITNWNTVQSTTIQLSNRYKQRENIRPINVLRLKNPKVCIEIVQNALGLSTKLIETINVNHNKRKL